MGENQFSCYIIPGRQSLEPIRQSVDFVSSSNKEGEKSYLMGTIAEMFHHIS